MSQNNVIYRLFKALKLCQKTADLYKYLLDQIISQGSGVSSSSNYRCIRLNILQISKNMNLSRNKIYELLETLVESKLIEYINGKKNHIHVYPLGRIKYRLLQKEQEVKKLVKDFDNFIPDIWESSSSVRKKSLVTTISGKNSIIYYLTQLAENFEYDSEVIGFAEGESFNNPDLLNYLFGDWVNKKRQKNVFSRILYQQNNVSILPFLKENPAQECLRDSKFLPQFYQSASCYWVSGDTLIHFDTALDRVVAIEDQSLADLHTQIFNQVWQNTTRDRVCF